MAARQTIDTKLSDADYAEMVERMMSRRYRVDDLHAWLIGKGYSVSRSAVGNKRKRVRQSILADLRAVLPNILDDDLRKRLSEYIERVRKSAHRLRT